MPFNRTQLRRISNIRGQAFIPRTRGNRALRIAESYLRRKLYSFEDKTIAQEYKLFRAAFDDIKARAFTSGKVDARWRRSTLDAIEPRIRQLARDVARNACGAANTAYRVGYYGRLWSLDTSTIPETPLRKPAPQTLNIDLQDWLERYSNEAEAGILRIRNILNSAVTNGLTPNQAIAAVGVEMGATRGGRGMFYRMQLQTRSAVMLYSNVGALNAFKAQFGLRETEGDLTFITGLMFVSSRDSRVCNLCQKLDGTVYVVGDVLGMLITGLPPLSTHLGCRCGYVWIVIPTFAKGDNEPPDDTFGEWLDFEGVGDLDGFMMGTELDSTQI